MPAFTFYQDFAEKIGTETHDLANDTLKVALTNTAPTATHTTYSQIAGELSTANGYTAGGGTLANVSWTESGGTATLDADSFVWTASGGSIGPAQYAVVYNDSAGSDELIGYVDQGSAKTAADGETFTFSIPTNLFTLS